MKYSHHLLSISLVGLLLTVACSQKPNIEITHLEHTDTSQDSDCIEKTGYLSYDSVTFSDQSYAVSMLQQAPQNWLVKYMDKDGKLIGTVSAASETTSQHLVYGYDNEGRLKYLLYFDYKREPTNASERCDSAYQHFRLAIDSIDFGKPNTSRHQLAEIKYRRNGDAYEVGNYAEGKVIKAPEGYKLNVSVKPGASFWTSDINGGRFYLMVDVVPVKDDGHYSIKRFVDLYPTIEEHYLHGRRIKAIGYPNPTYPQDVRTTTTYRRENGMNIYEIQKANSTDTQISIWKEGLPQVIFTRSKWGTLRSETRYVYLPSGEVKKLERGFDFKEKKLKAAVAKMIKAEDLPSEDDFMDPLENSNWAYIYGK